MNINKIVVNEKIYKLQHPGNREWVKLQSSLYDTNNRSLDMEKFLDYAFEHVVIPEKGNKLDLDNVNLKELTEVWQIILPRFLRGELDSGYVYPENKQSKKAGEKLLQKESQK